MLISMSSARTKIVSTFSRVSDFLRVFLPLITFNWVMSVYEDFLLEYIFVCERCMSDKNTF